MNRGLKLPKLVGWTKLPHRPTARARSLNVAQAFRESRLHIYYRSPTDMHKYFQAMTIQSACHAEGIGDRDHRHSIDHRVANGLILIRPNASGWNSSDLVSPTTNALDRPSNAIPGPSTSVYRAPQFSLVWMLSEVYASYGGVAWVSLNNTGTSAIFAYELSFQWSGTNITSSRPASALVQLGKEIEIGMLSFPAPSSSGHDPYSIQLKLAVKHPNGDWYD